MAKIQRSYRLEEQQVEQLEELIVHYEKEMYEKQGMSVTLSAAAVIESLVKRDYDRIQKEKGDGKDGEIQK